MVRLAPLAPRVSRSGGGVIGLKDKSDLVTLSSFVETHKDPLRIRRAASRSTVVFLSFFVTTLFRLVGTWSDLANGGVWGGCDLGPSCGDDEFRLT